MTRPLSDKETLANVQVAERLLSLFIAMVNFFSNGCLGWGVSRACFRTFLRF